MNELLSAKSRQKIDSERTKIPSKLAKMKIYNTLTRKKETFEPIKKGRVGMYVCGPTVYDEAHIGHARAAYIFEVIRNYLAYKGYKVKFVQNITDIDDKIIARAKEELPDAQIAEAVRKTAQKYTHRYYQDMDALGIRRADVTPRATEYIARMQEYIKCLLKKGFAYESDGSVYFEVRKFKKYGRLSRQNLEQMRSSARTEKDERKKDVLDFALWKKAKEGEPAWDSPWSKGRPGWHIECSVMSSDILGDEFDIHGGGIDLIFPHHENEIAQSRCFSGKGFAGIWMHNGLLTINGQKMAKSLGNFVSLREFWQKNLAQVLKLFFLSCHYRSPIDFNEKKINEAKTIYQKLQIVFDKLDRVPDKTGKAAKKVHTFQKRFEDAMDDDFNTPKALAVLFELMNFSNKLLDNSTAKEQKPLAMVKAVLQDYLGIFGIVIEKISSDKLLQTKVEEAINERRQLREKKDFAQADKIRRKLEEEGIILEDTKEGTVWRRRI